MTSESRYRTDLDGTDLERRLERAQARHANPGKDGDGEPQDGSAMGMAMRLGMEMVLSVCVALFIGWGLDEWLGTGPWLLLLFVPLGIVAGIMNVVRAAKSMQRPADGERQGK